MKKIFFFLAFSFFFLLVSPKIASANFDCTEYRYLFGNCMFGWGKTQINDFCSQDDISHGCNNYRDLECSPSSCIMGIPSPSPSQAPPNNCQGVGGSCYGQGGCCQGLTCDYSKSVCTSGGGVTCNPPLTFCNNQCVNTSNDNNNCGKCGIVCTGGKSCSSGQCVGGGGGNNYTCGGKTYGSCPTGQDCGQVKDAPPGTYACFTQANGPCPKQVCEGNKCVTHYVGYPGGQSNCDQIRDDQSCTNGTCGGGPPPGTCTGSEGDSGSCQAHGGSWQAAGSAGPGCVDANSHDRCGNYNWWFCPSYKGQGKCNNDNGCSWTGGTINCYGCVCPQPTQKPQLTQQSCTLKKLGDADCDGKIDSADFQIWQQEFTNSLKGTQGLTLHANFSGASFVDMGDFEIWRENFYK